LGGLSPPKPPRGDGTGSNFALIVAYVASLNVVFISALCMCKNQRRIFISGPWAILIGGPSGRFSTTDVIQVSTTHASYIH